MTKRRGRRPRERLTRRFRFAPAAAQWIAMALPGLGIEAQVQHSVIEHGKNALSLDHRIPSGDRAGRARYLITTNYRVLDRAAFRRADRGTINSASLERGRAIYCVDIESDEVSAALAYHVPDRGRLLIRAMALRQDSNRPDVWRRSRFDLIICKAYLHVFAAKIGRPAELLYNPESAAAATEASENLGFRPAKKVVEVRSSSQQVLCQPKLGW
jgi:hypothetical protein